MSGVKQTWGFPLNFFHFLLSSLCHVDWYIILCKINIESDVTLILAGIKKNLNKVNTKFDMSPRRTWWKERSKSNLP